MTDKRMKCIIDKENFNSLTNASKIVRAAVVVRFTRDVTEARLVVLESTAAAILTHATIDVKTRDVTNWHSCNKLLLYPRFLAIN